ncbi:uncharacterized protein LOC129583080 [Paramacrobiotus metropolitanus]|uniref:uncharacterized protein LOC129583080 n=1 Tax=Paramacrobiotus metropolitanus TaxID=2943436 RepID=UPI0024461D1F|nr:uncharacterized protein LOC129583080 [Paramacrobiotus metropolitanus]
MGNNASSATKTVAPVSGIISSDSAETVKDAAAPEIIGCSMQYRYTHADYIGKGAFGIVYRAEVTHPGSYKGEHVVAVKVIQPKAADREDSWKDALARLRKLVELSNKHLVAYYKISIFTAPGGVTVELAMEHFKGDLASFLKEAMGTEGLLLKRYSNRKIIKFTLHIARGLEFLHRNGIIHGDLKPKNILVKVVRDERERLQIGDLDDLVQMRENVTCSGDMSRIRGTTRYMSPEMLRKFCPIATEPPGRKTDIWSLGCIILEMAECLNGVVTKLLVKDKEILEAGNRISNKQYDILIIDGFVPFVGDDIEDKMAWLIRQCLHPVSKNRMSAEEIVHGIKQQKKQVIVLFPQEGHTMENCLIFEPFSGSLDIQNLLSPPSAVGEFHAILEGEKSEIVLVQREKVGTVANHVFHIWNLMERKWRKTAPSLRCEAEIRYTKFIRNKIYFLDEKGHFAEADASTGRAVSLETPPENCRFQVPVQVTKCGQCIFYATARHLCQYDTVNKDWRSLPDLPETRTSFAMAAINGYVYILGGMFVERVDKIRQFIRTADCIRLNVRAGAPAWEKIEPLPQPRMKHSACVVNDRIYVCAASEINVKDALAMQFYDTKSDAGWCSVNFSEKDIQLFSNFVAKINAPCRFLSALSINVDSDFVLDFPG